MDEASSIGGEFDVAVDPAGEIVGSCASGPNPGAVTLRIDGAAWATVPSCVNDAGGWSFACDPPTPTQGGRRTGRVEVLDGAGRRLAERTLTWTERRNGAGLAASTPLALQARPFFAVPYLLFDGAQLILAGSHLPPGGDPSALGVEFGPGVAYRFEHSLPSPGWRAHFWYWPNAGWSDVRLTIDLAASAPGSDPFTFRFTHAKGGAEAPEPLGRVWIPRDMTAGVGMPVDPTQLTRVQTWSTPQSALLTGYGAFRAIAALLARHGVGAEGTRLLDWGCGHGRVTRHFAREWPRATVVGMDVDAENIAWAAGTIGNARFVASPLLPPCPLEDASVDALFSISVMTHLTEEVQRLWLDELARVVRPGGVALMSFGGPGAVAWSSIWHTPAYVERWRANGVDAEQVDRALDGKISDATYYRNTAQTHEHVRRLWNGPFEILEILPEAIGNLDFAVLRRR